MIGPIECREEEWKVSSTILGLDLAAISTSWIDFAGLLESFVELAKVVVVTFVSRVHCLVGSSGSLGGSGELAILLGEKSSCSNPLDDSGWLVEASGTTSSPESSM